MPREPLDEWRAHCLQPFLSRCKHHPQHCGAVGKDIYEFGVFSGSSMLRISDAMRAANASFTRMWGFDSFQGLPEEMKGVPVPVDYTKGRYDSSAFFDASGNDLIARLETKIDDPRVRWVRGWYNETCTPQTLHMLPFSPALYVDLDCDLYVSTYQALDWLFSSKLIRPGTIIGYDDWIHGGPTGQEAVHRDITAKYGVKFLVRGPAGTHPAFRPPPYPHGSDLRCWMVGS